MSGLDWSMLADALTVSCPPGVFEVSTRPGLASTRFIAHELPFGGRVEIHDKWWRKNADVWVGYQVHIEDRDGIVRRTWPITKKRTDVVAAVCEALTLTEVD